MKPALLGGEKAVKSKYEIFPLVTEKGVTDVNNMMTSGDISISPIFRTFEERFASYIGVDYAVSCCNGTTSIQSALLTLGVGTGDEVIVPSFTFWATVGPVIACNAIPVFADVDIDMQTITAEHIKKVITPKTKAIIIVHTWGTPCDIEPIIQLAKEHNIKVIEDCSHAHGAEYNGKKVGSFGDLACFSLQGSKVLAAGEGGIMVTNNRNYYEYACALGHYERIEGFSENSAVKKFIGTGIGYKHRPHPLGIAIANAGLDVLDERNEIRYQYGMLFNSMISDLDFLVPQKTPEEGKRVFAYHYMRYVPEKLKGLGIATLFKALSAEGVLGGSCGYGKLHRSPFVTDVNIPDYSIPALPSTENLAINSIMAAPRFENVSRELIEEYAEAYHKIADNVDSLLEYEATLKKEELEINKNANKSINTFQEVLK